MTEDELDNLKELVRKGDEAKRKVDGLERMIDEAHKTGYIGFHFSNTGPASRDSFDIFYGISKNKCENICGSYLELIKDLEERFREVFIDVLNRRLNVLKTDMKNITYETKVKETADA